ncbi:DUF4864 domain-containing protein [Rhodobacteraceae bacterium NNCM2]|nr:DUF4864 domain-containing protein [Coraliihabitans acroporae]
MRFLASILVALMIALPAGAAEPEQSIQGVIADQIGAFQRSDLDRAFSHASPNVQRIFETPGKFGQMVRGGYPMIWRPARWEMLSLETFGGTQVQIVLFEDQNGELFEAAYEMIDVDGTWRINGVQLRRLPGMSS